MGVGQQWTYEGEEDGVPVSLLITVLDETRLIAGVTTRVIEEREWEDDELLEVSWNYFAQAGDGTICYFGEDVDIYEEEDEIVHEGAWCADESPNAPGIIMPADPRPGMKFPMESAPGIAEDEGKIVGSGPVTVPFGRFDETLRVREFNPLDGGKGFKVFGCGSRPAGRRPGGADRLRGWRRPLRVRRRSRRRFAEADMRETDRGSANGAPPSGGGNARCAVMARRSRPAG